MASERWRIHFFQRPIQIDPEQSVPAIDFLNDMSAKVAAEMQAVLEAVADAPPHHFLVEANGKPCTVRWQAAEDSLAK
jgi:hypothetical protein